MTQPPPPAPPSAVKSGSAKTVILSVIAGLLIASSVCVPIAVSWRNTAKEAQGRAEENAARAVAAAKLAEDNKQEAILLEKQKSEMRDNLSQAQRTVATLQDDLAARGAALEALKQVDAEKTKTVEAMKADLAQQAEAMAALDRELRITKDDVENDSSDRTSLMSRVNSIKLQISRMSETIGVQGAEITRLVEVTKRQQAEIAVAQKQARENQARAEQSQALAAANQTRAEQAQAKAVEAHEELMARAPIRIEERRSSKTGRKVGEKSGVPFGAALDPIGDVFTGLGEGLFGKSGPVILVGVFQDGHEEVMSTEEAAKWSGRGIRISRLTAKK